MQSIVRGFASDLTRPRRYNYSHDALEQLLLNHPDISAHSLRLVNPHAHQLDVLLLKHSTADTCILYAHGLGSNKLEALPIAKAFLKQGCDVCSFDFSGSGRSEGTMTTYGIYEKEDVMTVLRHIEKHGGYERVVLWGRSMGAVAVVLAHSQNQSSKVECLVLDSPFSSFEKVALQTAAKKSFIPQFMISMVMDPLKTYFKEHMPVNPFTIDLEHALSKIDTRMLLIYSLNDSVVHCSHAQDIVRHCRRNPQQIVIKEDHNMQRSKSTLAKTLKFIRDSAREAERRVVLSRSKNKGISVTSKDPRQRESVKSGSNIKLSNASTCKIKLVNPSSSKVSIRQASIGKQTDRCVRTIASLSDSMQYSKRTETEGSPCRRRKGAICSVYFENKYPEGKLGLNNKENKENIKPSLNMLRRNRFR